MNRIRDIRTARIDIAKKAANRWKERSSQRAETARQLRRGGPQAGNSAAEIAKFQEREPKRIARAHLLAEIERSFIERVIGEIDFSGVPRSPAERAAGLPVARIVEVGKSQGFGTGFMVAPGLLMTNHHVLENIGQTIGCAAQFGYEVGDSGTMRAETFELDAHAFFYANEALDYAIVAIKGRSLNNSDLAKWGHHKLLGETGKILKGHPVSIVQHPDGGLKQYASVNNQVVDLLPEHIHYTTDTRPGSSGSPGFNNLWEIVALHHSGVPEMEGDTILNDDGKPWSEEQGDDAIHWIANEGVRISRILAHLASVDFPEDNKAALRDTVLSSSGVFSDTADLDAIEAQLPSLQRLTQFQPLPSVDSRAALSGHAPLINVQGNATINFGTSDTQPHQLQGRAVSSELTLARQKFIEKKLKRDPDYGRRRGYDANFLHEFEVPLPNIEATRLDELVLDRYGNPVILDYHHYSLAMNRKWLLQIWSAVNVDYSPEVRFNISRTELGTDEWICDPRIPKSLQIEDPELYAPAKKFDRGHIVRRDDNAWGTTQEEMEFANSDTFHWTNCTPQHEDFNRAIFGHKGIWGKLEKHITNEANAVGNRLILFAGPVLNTERSIPHDFGGGLFRVPLDYWKVVVVVEQSPGRRRSRLKAFGFLLEQKKAIDQFGIERMPEERFNVGEFEAQQRSLAQLTQRTGVIFPSQVLDADVLGGGDGDDFLTIESLKNVKM
jgi:endonuclease G, mitochondrial